jgi:virulence-associated protein VagC
MEAAMHVFKWGDSLAVRLRKALVEKMGLCAGDELTIVEAVEWTLVVQKEDRRKAALDRLASQNWTLPPDYKFDRDEANERWKPGTAAGFAWWIDRRAGYLPNSWGGGSWSTTTKLFTRGGFQAVRLPKECRFESKQVRISRVGNQVILEPLKRKRFARLDELGARDFLPDGIPGDPPVEPDPRVFFDEWSASTPTSPFADCLTGKSVRVW